MEIIMLLDTIFTGLGILVAILAFIAPLTKATWDDKLLLSLKEFTSKVKLNKAEQTVLIQVK